MKYGCHENVKTLRTPSIGVLFVSGSLQDLQVCAGRVAGQPAICIKQNRRPFFVQFINCWKMWAPQSVFLWKLQNEGWIILSVKRIRRRWWSATLQWVTGKEGSCVVSRSWRLICSVTLILASNGPKFNSQLHVFTNSETFHTWTRLTNQNTHIPTLQSHGWFQ